MAKRISAGDGDCAEQAASKTTASIATRRISSAGVLACMNVGIDKRYDAGEDACATWAGFSNTAIDSTCAVCGNMLMTPAALS